MDMAYRLIFKELSGRPRRCPGLLRAVLAAAACACLPAWDAPAGAAQLAWTQTDWSRGQYVYQMDLDPDAQPGLLILENDPADPRFVAEPTAYRGIYGAAAYHDTLFLGAGPYPLNPDGAEVLAYDYLTGQFSLSFEPAEEGIMVMKTRGDTLYIPGPDTHNPIPLGSSVYLYNGQQWTTQQHVVGALHLFDLEVMDDAIYVSSGDGTGDASIYRSLDHGETFTPIFTLHYTPEHFVRRMHALAVHNGLLYAQPDGWSPEDDMVFTFDGADWDTLPVPYLPQGNPGEQNGWQGTYTAWGDSLMLAVKDKLFIFDEDHVHRSPLPFLCARMGSGFGAYRGALYGGAASGYLYRWQPGQGWTQVCPLGLDPATEQIQAVVTYCGRLYIATARAAGYTGGRLYVSGCALSGRLMSLAHDFGLPVYDGRIVWDQFSPAPEASARFQVRSALTIEGLPAAGWAGPDGTPATWFTQSGSPLYESHDGDRFFQYLVELHSPDGLQMPLLRSVTLLADSIPGAAVEEDPENDGSGERILWLEAPRPNPALAPVLLRAHLGAGLGPAARLALRILDVQGREVRAVAFAPDDCGELAWRWDLTDASGRRVPTGIYQILVAADHGAAPPAATRLLVLP